MLNIGKHDPLGVAVMKAIQSGDLDALHRLLDENPGLVTARIDGRTLLHVAADWPGHFPNGAAVVTALIAVVPIETPQRPRFRLMKHRFIGLQAATMLPCSMRRLMGC